MEEASWRRHRGGGIMEDASRRHMGGIWRHLGGIWEASEGISWHPRHLEASGRHLDDKSSATLTPNANLLRKFKFCDVFLKVRAPGTAIYDNLAEGLAAPWPATTTAPLSKPPEPLQTHLFGEKSTMHIESSVLTVLQCFVSG